MERIREFFHTKTLKEIMKENKHAIRRARRELEREKNRLVNEKTRNENEIRRLATKGEQVFHQPFLLETNPKTNHPILESLTNLCKKYRQST